MHIIIKDKHQGVKTALSRSVVRDIHSRVTTHEGEILTGDKGIKYRNKWIENGKYKMSMKRGQGNWK